MYHFKQKDMQIGDIIVVNNKKYVAKEWQSNSDCRECGLYEMNCDEINCSGFIGDDSEEVIFEEVKD